MTSTETLKPAHELAQHDRRFPNDSDDYRKACLALLAEEIELRQHIERVAVQRRALPEGGAVPQGYRFQGTDGSVRSAELFVRRGDSFSRPQTSYLHQMQTQARADELHRPRPR